MSAQSSAFAMSNSSIWFSGSGEPGADNTTDVAWSYLELLQLTDSGSLGRNLSSDCINENNTDLFVSRQYLNVPLDIIVLFWTSVSCSKKVENVAFP